LLLKRAALWGIYISAASTATIVLVSFVEIVSRYFLSQPTIWSLDLTTYLLCLSIFTALPAVVLQGKSISVNICLDMLHPRPRETADRMIETLSALVCLVILVIFVRVAITQYNSGLSTTGYFSIPKYLLTVTAATGFSLAAIMHLFRAVSRSKE
jgi:TRAP-type C4-dicarboxylate transport system permease small subunit